MHEFSTYVFNENEIKTHNLKVSRERPYYIGILIFLIGVILHLFDSDYAAQFIVIGWLALVIGQIAMSGRVPSIGRRLLPLKLTNDSIFIGKERLEIKNKQDVELKVVGYQGQRTSPGSALYQTHNGNDNIMRIRCRGEVTELKFVLESEAHKDLLIKFCKANEFEIE